MLDLFPFASLISFFFSLSSLRKNFPFSPDREEGSFGISFCVDAGE